MCVYLVQHSPDSDKMRSHTESHVSVSCVSDSLLQWRWKGCLEDTTSLPYHCLPLTSVQALSQPSANTHFTETQSQLQSSGACLVNNHLHPMNLTCLTCELLRVCLTSGETEEDDPPQGSAGQDSCEVTGSQTTSLEHEKGEETHRPLDRGRRGRGRCSGRSWPGGPPAGAPTEDQWPGIVEGGALVVVALVPHSVPNKVQEPVMDTFFHLGGDTGPCSKNSTGRATLGDCGLVTSQGNDPVTSVLVAVRLWWPGPRPRCSRRMQPARWQSRVPAAGCGTRSGCARGPGSVPACSATAPRPPGPLACPRPAAFPTPGGRHLGARE